MANTNSKSTPIRLEEKSRWQYGISDKQAEIIWQRVAFLLMKKPLESHNKLH